MDSHSRIGIYLRKDRATVVCLASQGREKKLLDSFSLTVEDQGQQNQQVLADQIAKRCAERKIKVVEASVALDCALFMQHRLHSEFSDPKKIGATVRFDAEEALATDISDMAVAFRVVSANEGGSELDVFTAERSVLSDILLSQQSNGVDPLTVEPDIFLLARCLCESHGSPKGTKESALYALLSDCRGYLIGIAQSHVTSLRAFPTSPSQDRNELLAREILLSSALAESAEPPQKLYVVDGAGALDAGTLQTKLKLPVESCDLAAAIGVDVPKTADSPNIVDLAIAFGAALPKGEKTAGINFRNDHMPHTGKKMRLQRAVRFASIGFAALFLALGVYYQTQYLKVGRDKQQLFDKKFLPDYLTVMVDRGNLPQTIREGITNLENLQRRLKHEKGGGGLELESSVAARLALILQTLTSHATDTDLRIDSIAIDNARITVKGSTSSRANTNKIMAAMPAAKLETGPQIAQERNNRDTFTMTLKPTKEAGK